MDFCSPIEFTWCRTYRINFGVNISGSFNFIFRTTLYIFRSVTFVRSLVSLLNWLVLSNVKHFFRYGLRSIITTALTKRDHDVCCNQELMQKELIYDEKTFCINNSFPGWVIKKVLQQAINNNKATTTATTT